MCPAMCREPYGGEEVWIPVMIKRRSFLSVLSAGAVALLTRNVFGGVVGGGRKPNIIIILADDLGYEDVSCQGAKDLATPHIDRLSKDGVRFTEGYVSAPVCSPSRAGLLTGRYQQRFGHEFNTPVGRGPAVGLPVSEKTMGDRLRAAGYATGWVGKSHLGSSPQFHPLNRGFDEFFGFLASVHSYTPPHNNPKNPVCRGFEAVVENEYLTDALTREAVSFMTRHKDEPFFLYVAYNAIHGPMEDPPAKYTDRFPQITDWAKLVHAGMVAALDDGVGAMLDKLNELGLENDTLVFFLSDNGGARGNGSDNGMLSGVKGTLQEGGIRVPFLMQWKGRAPAGKVYREPVISLDICVTALGAAGVGEGGGAPLDGVDLVPFVAGQAQGSPHERLYWRMGAEYAIRQGKWKLLKTGDGPPRLFDVAGDVGERADVSGREAEVVKQLGEAYARWDAQLAKPLWKPPAYRGQVQMED